MRAMLEEWFRENYLYMKYTVTFNRWCPKKLCQTIRFQVRIKLTIKVFPLAGGFHLISKVMNMR